MFRNPYFPRGMIVNKTELPKPRPMRADVLAVPCYAEVNKMVSGERRHLGGLGSSDFPTHTEVFQNFNNEVFHNCA